ncbi:MAG TPA: type II and III secretion system protein [Planctomycetota bacterium]|jgi:type II secretory pathway component GspD/PulD (secretin)
MLVHHCFGADSRARWARVSGICAALIFTALSPALAAEDPTAPAIPSETRPATPPATSPERPKIRKWLDDPPRSEVRTQPAAETIESNIPQQQAGELLSTPKELCIEEDAADRAARRATMMADIKCKLEDAKRAFKLGDYQQTVNIARNILSMDPRNIAAAEWLRKAQGMMQDADEFVARVAADRRDRDAVLEAEEHNVRPPPKLKALRPHLVRRDEEPTTARRKKMMERLEERVTVDFNKADLDFVLNTLFVLTGVNIIADQAALEGKTVTMRVLDLPIREVLDFIVRNNESIQYSVTEDAVWITATESADLKKIMYPRVYPIHFGLVSTEAGSGTAGGQRSGGTGRAGGGGGGRGGGRGGGGGGGRGGGGGQGGQGGQGAQNLEPSYLETVLKWIKDGKDPQVFPDGSDYMVDRQSNLLIVFTTAAGHEKIGQFLDFFDQPAIQVLIKTRFLTINAQNEKEIGINLDALQTRIGSADFTGAAASTTTTTTNGGNTGTVGTGTTNTTGNANTTTTTTTTGTNTTGGRDPFHSFNLTGGQGFINPGKLGPGNLLTIIGRRTDPQFQITLKALLNNQSTKVLSEPQVLAINNKQATIDITSHFSYITDLRPVTTYSTVGNGVATGNVPSYVPEFDDENIGFTLTVTPSVGRDLKTINLHLNPVIDDLSEGQNIQQFQNFAASIGTQAANATPPSIQRPTIDQTSLETDVVVEDNGYVILGGLIRANVVVAERKIPGLYKIPILGYLFKTKSTTSTRSNLVIIVEAQIITPGGRTYYKDPEPDDVGPREGGTNRAPGQVSDNALRSGSINYALGLGGTRQASQQQPIVPVNEDKLDAPRRSRPVTPVSSDPATAVADAFEPHKAKQAEQALSPRDRMERLAKASRATAQVSLPVGWTVPQEDEVAPAADAAVKAEVVDPK